MKNYRKSRKEIVAARVAWQRWMNASANLAISTLIAALLFILLSATLGRSFSTGVIWWAVAFIVLLSVSSIIAGIVADKKLTKLNSLIDGLRNKEEK